MTNGPASMIKALASALFLCLFSGMSAAQTSPEVDLFERSLDRLRAGDWREALILGESAGAVARDVVEWHRLRAGLGDFDAVQSFVERRADWPGLRLLRRESEEAVPIAARPEEVLAFFADTPPQTGAGELALIEAYRALGQPSDAEAEAVRAWLTAILSEADESAILARYGEALQPHHIARLDMLLWRNARQAAERMYPRVPEAQRALARARLALRADADGVDALIDAVPASLADDPGLAFERMQWRARKGRNDDAIALMLERNGSELGQAESWAGWRRAFVRTEMRAGRADVAYRLASAHGLADGSSFADLEWLSGYIALTYLNRADTALDHFRRFRASVASPISLGRAGYWEGRAYEALGDVENARLAYAFGGEYQTSFYGLLAAEKAGIPLDPMLTGRETFPNWRLTSFAESSVFEAARLFIAAGERNLAEQFLTHLAESLNEDELGSLGAYLDREGEPHLALMVAKMGAQRGRVIPAAYFPVVDLDIGQLPVPGELALAIARRESEFDPVVTSGAGARGLMQVMPATARAVAAELEIDYDGRRLLNDPVYNARIGTAYLDELMEVFDGNPVMVAAGYNAGPGRPFRWMTERGDPRRGQMDMIDWIEHIPFNETRNYVMRVTESLPVYRARLTGEVGPIRFSEELRAMPGHERQAIKGELIRPRARPAILTD